MIRRAVLIGLTGVLLSACTTKTSDSDATYYLVRHAEKTTDKSDPSLTQQGQKRAKDLAQRLSKLPLTEIYSSDYIRTRDTAVPTADGQRFEGCHLRPARFRWICQRAFNAKGTYPHCRSFQYNAATLGSLGRS